MSTSLVGDFTEPIEPIRIRGSRSNPTARYVQIGKDELLLVR
jgi:hypothetical protein